MFQNIYDSEVLMGQLRANGKMWRMKLQLRKRKLFINTCGFIDNAKAESVNMILEYADKRTRFGRQSICDWMFIRTLQT
jgi:ribosomal protein S12 methylthiotransferase